MRMQFKTLISPESYPDNSAPNDERYENQNDE